MEKGNNMHKIFKLALLSLLSLQATAYALPVHNDPFFGKLNLNKHLLESALDNYDFSGIIGLDNCSGSLIKFQGDENYLDKKAIILTNGHCTGVGSGGFYGSRMPAPGEAVINKAQRRSFKIFSKTNVPVGMFYSTKVIYTTMTDTDIALYEAELTYRQIEEKFNVSALTLATAKPQPGDAIEIISGYWKRGYACYMDQEIFKMKEGEWIWKNSIKYSSVGCETIGGTSGSPIISPVTREVVGINNTGNDNSDRACTVMNPCEIDEDGNVKDDDHRSYGQQTVEIYTCLDSKFNFDVTIDGCNLVH